MKKVLIVASLAYPMISFAAASDVIVVSPPIIMPSEIVKKAEVQPMHPAMPKYIVQPKTQKKS